jgi:hypothetical protein
MVQASRCAWQGVARSGGRERWPGSALRERKLAFDALRRFHASIGERGG